MRPLLFLTAIITLVSCQVERTDQIDSTHLTMGPIIPKKKHKKGFDKVFEIKENQEHFEIEMLNGSLIAHSRYLFLEEVEIEDSLFESMKQIEGYPVESSLLRPYELEDDHLFKKYKHIVGQTLVLNNHNRETYAISIKDLVIVHDRFVTTPYLAAYLDAPIDQNIYYAWVSQSNHIPYPFETLEDGDESEVLEVFQNSDFYVEFEEKIETTDDEDIYTETTIQSFEHIEGEKYYVIQHNAIGMCGSLYDNVTAVYTLKGKEIVTIAVNELDYFIIDMVDANNDDFPELLGGDFSSSVIFSLENGEIEELKQLVWSSNECPC